MYAVVRDSCDVLGRTTMNLEVWELKRSPLVRFGANAVVVRTHCNSVYVANLVETNKLM